MSPICARPSCMALTMSVPVSTTNILASTPCLAKKPFSAPINIGKWPKLLPITTSSLGSALITVLPVRNLLVYRHYRTGMQAWRSGNHAEQHSVSKLDDWGKPYQEAYLLSTCGLTQ